MDERALLWWALALGAACGARELDPAACAARFDVQRDKIIRTEESRDMGARYLSELDVGARAECLRLCCETDSCDVFVYEEKGPGSCYLFNCGPPEDFRCKFTAHGNFSSGVLAVSRQVAELQDRERLALASLRSASTAPPAPPPLPTRAPTTSAPPTSSVPIPHPDLLLTPGRCSRYQFECRHGGECVAVYNACDGVPQCADGSDEAPELGCPQPATAPPPPRPAPVRPRTPPPPTDGPELEPPPQLAERWPHRLAQAQLPPPPPHRYSDLSVSMPSSHIFSHKGGLLQEAEGAPPYAPFEPPAPGLPYAPYEPPAAAQPWPRRAWTQPQGMESVGGGPYGRGGGWGRAWPAPPPAPAPQRPDPEPMYVGGEVAPFATRDGTLRDSAKGAPAPRPPEPAPPAPPPPPPPRPHHTPPSTHEEVSEPLKPLAESAGGGADAPPGGAAAARAASPPDGLSEHPPSAVLLLVLGVAMTAGLGAMLACRARAARRRLRRGKPFAHDADYLVNGMYL